jgi:transcriptional regulator with XRE-family HTH domain
MPLAIGLIRVIAVLRALHGWSQAKLGREAAVNPSTVSLVENGRLSPGPEQLLRLASALGVPAAKAPILLEELDTTVLAILTEELYRHCPAAAAPPASGARATKARA